MTADGRRRLIATPAVLVLIVLAANFIVAINNFNCLLDLSTIQELNLISVNDNLDTISVPSDFGTVNLKLDKNIRPKTLP